MVRPKKIVAEPKAVDLNMRKVSVREVLQKQEEMHGKPGDPPKTWNPVKEIHITLSAAEQAERRADFSGANFANADLSGMNLKSIKFRNCDMTGVDFTDANLQGCDFTGAIMTDCIMTGADRRWAIAPNGKAFPE